MCAAAGAPASACIWALTLVPPTAPCRLMLKPSEVSDGIAHTGLTAVRIDFDSAVSIEIACSGLVAEPLLSIQRPSQPVLTLRS